MIEQWILDVLVQSVQRICDTTGIEVARIEGGPAEEKLVSYPASAMMGILDDAGKSKGILILGFPEEHLAATIASYVSEAFGVKAEGSIQETRASSAVKEDSRHLGVREEPPAKESSGSYKYEPPKITKRVRPIYPFSAMRQGLTGKVSVTFLVDTDGHTTNIEAVKAEPENVLVTFAEAAEKAIAKWRFKPGTRSGEPVKVPARIRGGFEI